MKEKLAFIIWFAIQGICFLLVGYWFRIVQERNKEVERC